MNGPRTIRFPQAGLVLWLLVFSLVAWLWPHTGWWDPFVNSKPVLPWLIAVTMFLVGCLLSPQELHELRLRWPWVLGGTTLQYCAMPLLAVAISRIIPLSEAATIGVVMVGCVPGAMASNVLTWVARGNVSYSVSLTTAATLLSPLIVPLVLSWALGASRQTLQDQFNAWQVARQLLLTVVLPVLVGHLLLRFWVAARPVARQYAGVLANGVILWIIAVVVALNRDQLTSASALLLVALLSINLAGYVIGYGGGWLLGLPEGMRRALTLEVGMQNAGLGTVLALELFSEQPAAAIPPALYTFGCMLTGTTLAQVWRSRKEPANK